MTLDPEMDLEPLVLDRQVLHRGGRREWPRVARCELEVHRAQEAQPIPRDCEDRLFLALGRFEQNHRVESAAHEDYDRWRASARDTKGRVLKGSSKPFRGRQLYAKRKITVEPVYGQIKYNRHIDRFMRRGRAAAQSEWRLVTAFHIFRRPLANSVVRFGAAGCESTQSARCDFAWRTPCRPLWWPCTAFDLKDGGQSLAGPPSIGLLRVHLAAGAREECSCFGA